MKKIVNLKVRIESNLTGFKGLSEAEDLADLISDAVQQILDDNIEEAIGDQISEYDEDGDGNVEAEITVDFARAK